MLESLSYSIEAEVGVDVVVVGVVVVVVLAHEVFLRKSGCTYVGAM
jgi:hypothetical protein